MEKLIAIDGNSLVHRAFYALPPMTTADGKPTGALHGFFGMLLKLIATSPDYLAVGFDMHGPTFRHKEYADYKAGRKETPDDLRAQIRTLRELLKKMGICVIECESFEADDILGTLSHQCEEQGIDALLVTGDRDALQLVSPSTHVLMTKKGISETVEFTPEVLAEAYGLAPDRMRDLKGLMGDSSDNIPGVPGVGEKTALKLLSDYGSLENVLACAGEIPGKLGERIRDSADSARLSYRIGTIDRNAPIAQTLEDCRFRPERIRDASADLLALELRSIVSRLPKDESAPTRNDAQGAPTYETVPLETEADVAKFAREAELATQLAIDFSDALSFSVSPGRSYMIRQGDDLAAACLEPQTIWRALGPALENPNIPKIVFDSKRLRHILARFGLALAGDVFDLMIADYLLNAVRPAGTLAALVERRLHGETCCAALLFSLRDAMQRELVEADMLPLYTDMEYPLSKVLFEMEREGFLVDEAILHALGAQFERQIADLSAEIYALAGETFNILSPKQLGHILFEKLGLNTGRKNKTGFSTDADTLENLADSHPVVPKVLEYRFVAKLKSTFIDGLLQSRSPDGRIRTQFNQCVTATGRISSTEPNLQNIPVRTEQGREIRKAFVSSPGNVLVGADYSQIELRILAHLSGDERMIAAFNSGADIHRRTASEVFGVPFSDVSNDQRSAAKAVNFGIVYGISDFGLARNLGIPVKQAARYIQQYFMRYERVHAFMQDCVQQGKERGYAVTMFRRRRALPELTSGNYNTRSFGERVAMNMPIQGSAADIIKLAMVRVTDALKKEGLAAKLILQIHDELIIDTPAAEAERVAAIVHEAMEQVAKLAVPLEADVKTGHSWYDTK